MKCSFCPNGCNFILFIFLFCLCLIFKITYKCLTSFMVAFHSSVRPSFFPQSFLMLFLTSSSKPPISSPAQEAKTVFTFHLLFLFIFLFKFLNQTTADLTTVCVGITYQILEDKQHHSSCDLRKEYNQHDAEELNVEKVINDMIKLSQYPSNQVSKNNEKCALKSTDIIKGVDIY